jgi:hypothetical protein
MEKRQYEGRMGDDNREPSTPKNKVLSSWIH